MKLTSLSFIRRVFRDYYREEFPLNTIIPIIDKREFGFSSFENQMVRHKSFKNIEEVKNFMQTFVPCDAYYSCAYYENPATEMDRKVWLGSDLVFDIDADHIPTPCNKIHDEWICCNCGFAGKGITPKNCPICGREKFEVNTWLCQDCLDTAKGETIKLLDILKNDFGFSENDMHVFFSGHRGYHIHVENEAVQSLDAVSRKEIVDYIYGIGFDAGFQGLNGKKMKDSSSWHIRINKGLYNFILNADEEDFERIGLKKKVVRTLLEKRDEIVKNLKSTEPWKSIRGIGPKTWKKIFDSIAQKEFVKIDTVVTADVHRLVRLTNTLHGKTGFKKVESSISRIDSFDPFKDAIAFKKGTKTIFIYSSPQFRIGDQTFGPYKNIKKELPVAAAVLLICKDRAEVSE